MTTPDDDRTTADEPAARSPYSAVDRTRDRLDAVRRPEYTGENRCWPCTALNAAILGICSAIAWLLSPFAALALAGVGAAAIVVRGYLFPYTPRVGPRIAAALPGDAFETEERRLSGSIADADPDEELAERVLAALERNDVLAADEAGVYVTDQFWQTWEAEMDGLRDASIDELETAVGDAADGAEVDAFEGSTRAYVEVTASSGKEPLSRHVAVAEAAAVFALREFTPNLDEELRVTAVDSLKMFLERCPVCGDEVVETSPTACCGSVRNPQALPDAVLACPSCDVQLHVLDQ